MRKIKLKKRRIKQDKINEHRKTKKLDNPDYDKPKDPEYFKKYYLNKLQGVKYYCECCKIEVFKHSKSKHEKTKAHVKNNILFKLGDKASNNIDDVIKDKLNSIKIYCNICNKFTANIKTHNKSEIHILKEKYIILKTNEHIY